MDFSIDPASAMSHQAAAVARAVFTARIGENDDSHATWSTESAAAVAQVMNEMADLANSGDVQGAVEFAGRWIATYLAASSLLSEQLLKHAILAGYLAAENDPDDEPAARAYFIEHWDLIRQDVFEMLVAEDRTIV